MRWHNIRSVRWRGFSLIEVLVSLAVLLIIGGIVVTAFLSAGEMLRLDSSARRVVGRLEDARFSAIKRNRHVWLTIDIDARAFQVQSAGPVNIGPMESLAAGVDFANPTALQITFDSLGRPTPALAQTVTLRSSSSGQLKSITVTAPGRITIN